MDEQLKSCPFCGSESQIMDNTAGGFSVECKKCSAEIGNNYESVNSKGLYENHDSAVAGWNNRHLPEGCTPEDAKKLREFNHDLAAENQKLRDLLKEAAEYLDTNELTVISSSSVLHRKFKEVV